MLITLCFSLWTAAFVCDDLHHPASYAFARCFSKQQSRNGADGCAESHRIAASALDEAGRDDMGRIVDGVRRAPAKEGCRRVCAVLSHQSRPSALVHDRLARRAVDATYDARGGE